jgi:hypothetical protein
MLDKEKIILRLDMLQTLIEKTYPEVPDKKVLFQRHLIETTENIQFIRDVITSKSKFDIDTENQQMIRIMKTSNRYWQLHNKVLDGDFDSVDLLEMEDTIIDYLNQGSKINAIKYYREFMLTHMNERVTLREAKDKIDAYDKSMKVSLI